jgi:hypothetical protein
MHLALLAAVLSGLNAPAESATAGYESLPAAAADIGPQLQTGTLIFSQGDCLAVRVYSASSYTHVAAVVVREGTPYVYDSMNGCGVRKQSLEDYLVSQSPDRIHVFQPRQPFTAEQGTEFEAYLESRLGTPYAVMHHLSGERSEEGIHCAEYVTDALMSIDRIRANKPARVSPASLARGIAEHEVYLPGETIELERPAPPPEEGANWCERMWIATRLCCLSCCDKMSGWFLCR